MSGKVGRPRTGRTPNFSIRIKPSALNVARSAAERRNVTLGCWLEEAISEKDERQRKSGEESNR